MKKAVMIMIMAIWVVGVVILAGLAFPILNSGASADRKSAGNISYLFLPRSSARVNVTILGDQERSAYIGAVLEQKAANVTYLSSPEHLANLAPNQGIVCIDVDRLASMSGADLASALHDILLQGTPILTINDTRGMLRSVADGNNISYVGGISTENFPILARGLKYDPDGGPSASVDIGGDGTVLFERNGTIESAYDWAADHLNNLPRSGIDTDDFMIDRFFEYSCCSGDLFSPYGRFTIENTYVRMIYNDSTRSTFYFDHYRIESTPGYGAYYDDYRTMSIYNYANVTDDRTRIADHGPTTSHNSDNEQVALDVNSFDYLGIWSYPTQGVSIKDESYLIWNNAGWEHDIDSQSYAAKEPYIAEPGVFCVLNGPDYSFYEKYSVTWGRPAFLSWEQHSGSMELQGHLS